MELKIKPFHHNLHAKRALFIKGKSAEYWISELQKIGVHLNTAKCYEIFDKENMLQGCLVVFPENIRLEIFQHQVFQLAGNSLFIPEYSTIFPEIAREEWKQIFQNKKYFLHPEIGFQELSTEIIWTDYLKFNKKIDKIIVKPLKSAKIPKEMKSLLLDLDEEDVLQELEENQKPDPNEKLPFDMQKLLKGNQKELAKYLKFLEENPEKALQYAVPLDILNSSRDQNGGIFSFKNNKFSTFSKNNPIGQFVTVVLTILLGVFIIKSLKTCNSESINDKQLTTEVVAVQNSIYSTENTEIQLKKDSLMAVYKNKLGKKYHSRLELGKKLETKEKRINDSLNEIYTEKYTVIAANLFEKNKEKYLKQYIPESEKKLDNGEKTKLFKVLRINKIQYFEDSLKKKYGFSALSETKPILKEIPFVEDSLLSIFKKSLEEKKLPSNIKEFKTEAKKQYLQDSLIAAYHKKIEFETDKIYVDSKNKWAEMKKNIPPNSIATDENIERQLKTTIRDSLENEYGYSKKEEIPEAPPIPETKTIDEKTEVSLFDSVLRALAFIVLAMIAIFMFSKRNYNQTFWESISFSEDGQNNLAKILAGIVIVSCIVYVLKPLLETSGYGLYFWIITIIIFFLLLRLLNKNRTLLNKKDDENT